LSVQDYLTLTDMMPYLVKIGFDIKEFGKNTVVIEAVPMEIKTGQEAQVLTEMIEAYREYSDETNDAWDAVAKSFACKSAIKSGDKLSQQEMASLIDQLFATNEPYLCPHGRPIVVNLSLEEIDKRFGR
jgi:DNA mismatch repair protein MutL